MGRYKAVNDEIIGWPGQVPASVLRRAAGTRLDFGNEKPGHPPANDFPLPLTSRFYVLRCPMTARIPCYANLVIQYPRTFGRRRTNQNIRTIMVLSNFLKNEQK